MIRNIFTAGTDQSTLHINVDALIDAIETNATTQRTVTVRVQINTSDGVATTSIHDSFNHVESTTTGTTRADRKVVTVRPLDFVEGGADAELLAPSTILDESMREDRHEFVRGNLVEDISIDGAVFRVVAASDSL